VTDPVLAMLLEAVVAEPDSDLHRLAFADRLEETGADVARADFIRVQLELARPARCGWEVEDGAPCPQYNARRPSYRLQVWCPACAARENALPRLQRRNQELLQDAVYWRAWLADIYRITGRAAVGDADACAEGRGTFAVRFRRGFVAGVKLPCADWMGFGPALVRVAPLEALRLTDKQPYFTFTRLWGWSRLEEERDAGSPAYLPPALYDLLPQPDEIAPPVGLWRTESRAEDALSVACLAWARATTPEAVAP
jgi:uncharacterized protein (TIGR02996 family)